VALEDGRLKRLGRVIMRRDLLEKFAAALSKDDVVVVEATGNAAAVATVIGPHVKRVVIANPKRVRIIAHAKIKMDTIDAAVLAQLYASGFLRLHLDQGELVTVPSLRNGSGRASRRHE
jgi:transposase